MSMKTFVIVAKEQPKIKKSKKNPSIIREITHHVREHKRQTESSRSSNDSQTTLELMDNILELEKMTIKIINETNNIDCSCCIHLKTFCSGNKTNIKS